MRNAPSASKSLSLSVLATGFAVLLAACGEDRYSATDYPTAGALRYSWNTDKPDGFHVAEWQALGSDMQISPIGASGNRLHYNAEDNAFGILGPDDQNHAYLCGMLFEMFSDEEEAITILNSLGRRWTGSGDLSFVRSGIEYRIFKVAGQEDITCNVLPAMGKQDTAHGEPICGTNQQGHKACYW